MAMNLPRTIDVNLDALQSVSVSPRAGVIALTRKTEDGALVVDQIRFEHAEFQRRLSFCAALSLACVKILTRELGDEFIEDLVEDAKNVECGVVPGASDEEDALVAEIKRRSEVVGEKPAKP